MIYRMDIRPGEVHEPLDWKVFTSDRRRVQLSSEEALRAYLGAHPDEDFFLIPGAFDNRPCLNREIQGERAATFDPREHIRCGLIRYDSASGVVVTRDTIKVTYTDRAKESGEGFALLQRATKRLEEGRGSSRPWIMAEWDRREDDKGRSVFVLRLSDWTGSRSETFAPDKLQSDLKDLYRWRRLWGDLLQDRSQQQLAELMTSTSVPVGE